MGELLEPLGRQGVELLLVEDLDEAVVGTPRPVGRRLVLMPRRVVGVLVRKPADFAVVVLPLFDEARRWCAERSPPREVAARLDELAADPVFLDMLADGRLNLTSVRLLEPHLTEGNHQALLAEVSAIDTRYGPRRLVRTTAGTAANASYSDTRVGQPSVVTRAREILNGLERDELSAKLCKDIDDAKTCEMVKQQTGNFPVANRGFVYTGSGAIQPLTPVGTTSVATAVNNAGVIVGWTGGTAIGAVAGDSLADPATLGLDAAFRASATAALSATYALESGPSGLGGNPPRPTPVKLLAPIQNPGSLWAAAANYQVTTTVQL